MYKRQVQALEDIKKAGCDALVVYLGNFGPEISETLLAKHFDGPKMFVAAAEESGDNLLDGRGDAYCGMLNASYNLKLRNIKAYIPEYPVGTAEECADMIHEFLPIARTVKALSELKIISFGPRPLNFLACNAPIKPLYDLGIEIEENSELDLFEAFKKQIKYFLDIKIQGSNVIEKIFAEYMPVPFLSIITNDCISRGKDYNGGGARYNTKYLQGVGIGTITDCLSAVKYNVYDKKTFTMAELMQALDDNFEGHDRILNLVRNKTPKYGNDDDYADDIMKEVFEYYRSQVTGRPNMLGGMYRINMLPTTCHVYFGDVMMASPNGRLAHKPVSEGISPEKGADTNGPTAVVKSCAKMDHLQTGGTLLNQKFTPSVVAGEEGLDQMANLVRTYFNMDGHHIQFNVIDKETLIQAQKHPEDYKDLIVRVAGYSDHFRNLSKALQDEIIERTEQSFN